MTSNLDTFLSNNEAFVAGFTDGDKALPPARK